jgi:hypothetical protein
VKETNLHQSKGRYTNRKRQQILDERKNQQNTPSSFDLSYMYCRLQLGCDFFCEQWE